MDLTNDQSIALEAIKGFLTDYALDAFVLRGSAGTGKTTLIAQIVELAEAMHRSCALLAPTGRAARILGNKVQQALEQNVEASTIHKAIFSFEKLDIDEKADRRNDPGIRMFFPLKEEELYAALLIVDEASMVGDRETSSDVLQFGTGRLLNDLVTYSRLGRSGRDNGRRTKLILVGDTAQLPPVGENTSPALSEDYLASEFGLNAVGCELREVLRQSQGSAILDRATNVRDAISKGLFNSFSLAPDGIEIRAVDRTQALDLLDAEIREKRSSVAVVSSNASALQYNRSLRGRLWGDPVLPLQPNETLLVNRNSRVGLQNGDLVKVISLEPEAEHCQIGVRGVGAVDLRFRSAEVAFRQSDGTVLRIPCLLLENLLDSPNRELSPGEQRALLIHFRARHPDLQPKSAEFAQAILNDPYFNAVQVKYGYAMTCHKAQGGEWDSVIVDFEGASGRRNAAFFRWAYTAITRAKQKLVVVEPPQFDVIDDDIWSGPVSEPSPTQAQESNDLDVDPDWNRLSFSPALAPLLSHHQKLRERWSEVGIAVTELQHLQYCERYTLVRGTERALVQYQYNGKFRIRSFGSVPGQAEGQQLTHDALAAIQEFGEGAREEQPNQFISEFLERLDSALDDSPIKRAHVKPMPYRLRVSFSDASRRGDIDFTYNGSFTWTAAQEVGGPGASSGIYESVQALMTNRRD